jgi:endonuclease/exonuclease/phosphatase (EEP) superfamily protein YafD
MNWILRILAVFLLVITLLPLIPTGKWYVRWWDFPRLQIAFLLLIPLAIGVGKILRSGFQVESTVWSITLLAALVWQTSHIIPLSPVWWTEVADSDKVSSGKPIKIMVSNLDYENGTPDRVSQQLAEEDADVLLLVEIDDAWNEQLSDLRSQYGFHHDVLRGEGLGMSIWSKLPMSHAETQYLVSDRRASLWARVETASGQTFNFVGVHPTPPGLLDSTGETRRDSRVRDAELIMIAKEIASRPDEAWIVAGDFNDVAWSHTTRLFKRTSGLLDPRIGRTFMGTYIADNLLCRCPIDHVFLSEGFTLGSLSRKKINGSDHFAILATVSLCEPNAGVTPAPQGDDPKDAKEIIEEGKADAVVRDVAAF